jgi:hypothetical protein
MDILERWMVAGWAAQAFLMAWLIADLVHGLSINLGQWLGLIGLAPMVFGRVGDICMKRLAWSMGRTVGLIAGFFAIVAFCLVVGLWLGGKHG